MGNEIIINENQYKPYCNGDIKEIWLNNENIWKSNVDLWLGSSNRIIGITKDLFQLSESNIEYNNNVNGRRGIYFYNDYYFIFHSNGNPNYTNDTSVTLKRTKDGKTIEDIFTIENQVISSPLHMYYLNGYLIYTHWKYNENSVYIKYSKDGIIWNSYTINTPGHYDYVNTYSSAVHISICFFKGSYYLSTNYRNSNNNINQAIYKCTNNVPNNFFLWTEIANVSRPGSAIFCNENYLYWTYYNHPKVYTVRFNNPEQSTSTTILKEFVTNTFADGDGYISGINGLMNIINKYAYCSYIQHGNNSDFVYSYRTDMETGEVIRSGSVPYNIAKKDGYYYYVDGYQRLIKTDGISSSIIMERSDYLLMNFNNGLAYGEPNMLYS